jgi:26S proteasome regulatory subunit N2
VVAGGVSLVCITDPCSSEALYEDESFPERQLASLVLAKVFYHLGEYDESMNFALGAGDLFKLGQAGEFEETIISKCVDTYITLTAARNSVSQEVTVNGVLPTLATSFVSGATDPSGAAALTSPTTPFSQSALPSKSLLSRASTNNIEEQPVQKGKDGSAVLPDRAAQAALQQVIERLFESCLAEGRYRQVVGIAVEARNLDVLRQVIKRASDDERKLGKQPEKAGGAADELMEYILDICMGVVQERGFRTKILRLILELLSDIETPDYFSIAKCVVYLNQDVEGSLMLKHLVVRTYFDGFLLLSLTSLQAKDDQESTAIAYQIAFDLYDNGTQEFLAKVIKSLPKKVDPAAAEEKENRG